MQLLVGFAMTIPQAKPLLSKQIQTLTWHIHRPEGRTFNTEPGTIARATLLKQLPTTAGLETAFTASISKC